MILQVEELKSTLVHSATALKRLLISAVRPHIYKHLSPSGTFTITVSQGGDDLGSQTFTSASIESTTDATAINYFHAPVTVQFTNPIVVNRGVFEITLSHSGYTFSESAYIGWIREHERTVNDFTAPSNSFLNPLALEIWSFV